MLTQQLDHIDFLDDKVETISLEIERQLESMSWPEEPAMPDAGEAMAEGTPVADPSELPLTWNAAVALLDTMPGVKWRVAEVMLAETGLDMSQFPTPNHLASWAGLAPGNHQSGGKRYSGRTTKGNKSLASIMVLGAWSAVRTKGTFLKSRYHRLAARRGRKRAIVAVAHSMLVSAWHMLTYQQPYQELGGDYFDERKKEAKVSIRRTDHNQYLVSTSLAQTHLHQPDDRHGVQIGHLPQVPSAGTMYKALSQALTGKACDSGACGSFAPPVHTMQNWWNQVYRPSTW